MFVIDIEHFNGLLPRVEEGKKPEHAAITAWNCDLRDTRIRPLTKCLDITNKYPLLNADLDRTTVPDNISTLKFIRRKETGYLLWWGSRKEVVPFGISNDEHNRVLVSSLTESDKTGAFVVGWDGNSAVTAVSIIKEPLPAPIVTVVGPVDPGLDTRRWTRWFQTWVDKWGYESPLSDASNEVEYNNGQSIVVAAVLRAPQNAISRRLYKSITSDDGDPVILFVHEQPVLSGRMDTVTLSIYDEALSGVAPDFESSSKNIGGIVQVPGGFFAGFDLNNRRELRFSEVGIPYSFPLKYMQSYSYDNIVRLGVIGNSVVVLTDNVPFIVTGYAPDSMATASFATSAPCLSALSVVHCGGSLFYASDRGIERIAYGGEGSGVLNITDQWFDRKAWSRLNPKTCRGVEYNGIMYFWFPDSEVSSVRAIKLILQDGLSMMTSFNEPCIAACAVPEQGIAIVR